MRKPDNSVAENPINAHNSNTSTPAINDDKKEVKKRHAVIMENRRIQNARLLSPSPVSSPKNFGKLLSPAGSSGRLLFQSPSGNSSALSSTGASPLLSKKAAPKDMTPVLSRDQMNKLFDEWMKFAADNKINTNNTWNFALIDYFSELSVLRDGDSINFQKASCTLDGCVKIYTSRVDSVANETGKLLSGLSENENEKSSKKSKSGLDDEDEGDDDDDDDDDGNAASMKSSKKKKVNSTIEKSETALNVKKLDMEFDVDPLFKKTCADFDESGASGLLLNNLSMNSAGKIVFDAGEIISYVSDENYQDSITDVSQLMASLNITETDLEEMHILQTFHGFEASSADSADQNLQELFRKISENAAEEDLEELVDDRVDYQNFDASFSAAYHNDHMPGLEFDEPLDADYGYEPIFTAENDENNRYGEKQVLTQKEYVVSLANGEENMYSYFDEKLFKNWAGPEHWKLRTFNAAAKAAQSTSTTGKKVKKDEKKTLTIDFVNAPFVDPLVLFANKSSTSGTATSIGLSKNILMEREKTFHLLPEDLHFKSKDLLSFFSKPNWKLTGKEVFVSVNKMDDDIGHKANSSQDFYEGQVDHQQNQVNFINDNNLLLAPNVNNEDGCHENAIPMGPYDDIDDPFEPIDRDNNGYYDDDDGFEGFPDEDVLEDSQNTMNNTQITDGSGPNTYRGMEIAFDFGNALVAQPALTKTIKMNFAKSAKKVDVKKLKDNIWKEISEVAVENDTVEFTDLVKGLSGSYTAEKLQDISVPFCFICLLHLANERNLEIKSSTNLSELLVSNMK